MLDEDDSVSEEQLELELDEELDEVCDDCGECADACDCARFDRDELGDDTEED